MGEPGSLDSGDPAGVRSWCLRRVGMDAEWLLLEDGREVSIGRGFGVTYQLVSKICPLMISRNHCVLKQNPEGQWTIMDNKSLNGVWLNRERLEPLKFYFIHKGDQIQLGVPLQNKGLEKEQVEALKQQLAQALQEHQTLMEELNRSKKDFETIIQAKNKELEQTKEEKQKVQAQKEEVLSHMNDVLENELQCIICSEYFIEAVTLNCAHSFCSYCISEWMKRKIECPICRKDIKSKTHSLVLDNCIDKMVDNLSSEVKERRIDLIRERKVLGSRPKALRTSAKRLS
ncbi:E3 ubiquitin-protein ligase RNF8 isoform X2 [Heterocephalus glaber]|uniref:E3 ubiquitin-protein ligase CHFR n=1 Tax=Heterocephalus glaber TaxID=10181 RepID=A0AAX6QU86_HETGA|nr:E3 ubiquitin-protein ligase RNF8 isoform X2 [Heterocephalus glaber]